MGTYNGLVATSSLNGSTDSQVLATGAQQNRPVSATVPNKYFADGQFAINVTGISGLIGVQIVGGVGGATYVIAGRTNISATGGFPIPLFVYQGTSGIPTNFGIPRPAYVSFQAGVTGAVGVTASVSFAGRY